MLGKHVWNTSVIHNNKEALGQCLFALHYTGRSTHKKWQVERQTARNPMPSAPHQLWPRDKICTHIYIYIYAGLYGVDLLTKPP